MKFNHIISEITPFLIPKTQSVYKNTALCKGEAIIMFTGSQPGISKTKKLLVALVETIL